MELDEWELLSEEDDGELSDRNQVSPRRNHKDGKKRWDLKQADSDTIIHTDYFQLRLTTDCRNNNEESGDEVPNDQIAPVPVQEETVAVKEVDSSTCRSDHHRDNHLLLQPRSIPPPYQLTAGHEDEDLDLNLISPQVFIQKPRITEVINQFADMKPDSAKSINMAITSPQFEERDCCESETSVDEGLSKMESQSSVVVRENEIEGSGLNLWRMGTTGIGAVCSFGFACATTICIVILGSRGGGKKKMMIQQQGKLRFQIYTADKRMTDVVARRTVKLNSAMRGGYSYNRAEITVGGYYDGRL